MIRFVRWAAGALVLIALLNATAVAAQEAPKAAQPPTARFLEPPGGALVAAGNAPDLIFLYSGDVIGYIEPCG